MNVTPGEPTNKRRTSFLDAYGMGANDVANSFATSVSSRSLSFRQAILAAAVCEFLGAILVGSRVASTIKDDIIPLSNFPTVGFQMLGFGCVSAGSATFQLFATSMGMPVSATHTVIGACAIDVQKPHSHSTRRCRRCRYRFRWRSVSPLGMEWRWSGLRRMGYRPCP